MGSSCSCNSSRMCMKICCPCCSCSSCCISPKDSSTQTEESHDNQEHGHHLSIGTQTVKEQVSIKVQAKEEVNQAYIEVQVEDPVYTEVLEKAKHVSTGVQAKEYVSTGVLAKEEHVSTGVQTQEHVSTGVQANEHVSTGVQTNEEHVSPGVQTNKHVSTGVQTNEEHVPSGVQANEEYDPSHIKTIPVGDNNDIQKNHLWQQLVRGDVTLEIPYSTHVIRIFISSTFSDLRHERDALITDVFPKLKDACRRKGYRFQVIDMRWGVREYASNYHSTEEICLQEIDRCIQISEGPCFVAILSERYGYRCFPNKMDATLFELLLKEVTEDEKKVMEKWFKIDKNVVPATYILQPIDKSLNLEHSVLFGTSAEKWYKENEKMLKIVKTVKKNNTQALPHLPVEDYECLQQALTSDERISLSSWFQREQGGYVLADHIKSKLIYKEINKTQMALEEAVKDRLQIADVRVPVSAREKRDIVTSGLQDVQDDLKSDEIASLKKLLTDNENTVPVSYVFSKFAKPQHIADEEKAQMQRALEKAGKIQLHLQRHRYLNNEKEKQHAEILDVLTIREKALLQKYYSIKETMGLSTTAHSEHNSDEMTLMALERAVRIFLEVSEDHASASNTDTSSREDKYKTRKVLKRWLDINEYKKAKRQWEKDMKIMQMAMYKAAQKYLVANDRPHSALVLKLKLALMQSVTEAEIRRGVMADNKLLKRSRLFFRNIKDVHLDKDCTYCVGYKPQDYHENEEYKTDETLDEEVKPHTMLKKLKRALEEGEESVPNDEGRQKQSKITEERSFEKERCRITKYDIQWNTVAEKDEHHQRYIDTLCDNFKTQIMEDINGLDSNMSFEDRYIEEIKHHTRLCQDKIRQFCGRRKIVEKVAKYIQDNSKGNIYVLSGNGSGTTSIMAMAAKTAWKVHDKKGVVILRFLDTSQASTKLYTLLESLIYQLQKVQDKYNRNDGLPLTTRERVVKFYELLKDISLNTPVTVILDSLDKLDKESRDIIIEQALEGFPDRVHIILSTDTSVSKDEKVITVQVPKLGEDDKRSIFKKWLKDSKRKLSKYQSTVVEAAFKSCDHPLFLKMCFDTACKWHSFTEDLNVKMDAHSLIHNLFDSLEEQHGKLLVSRALGLISQSEKGFSEEELEGILSNYDDVLDDVFQYWSYPGRQLPPHLIINLKNHIGHYLVEREQDGVIILYWCHQKFLEAARERYCKDKHILNKGIANFFHEELTSDEMENIANQSVSRWRQEFSPLILRKLTYIPKYVIDVTDAKDAKNLKMLKEKSLLNYYFLTIKLQAAGIKSVCEDFRTAATKFPEDEDIKTAQNVLNLSEEALHYDPSTLASQVINRYKPGSKEEEENEFITQCKNACVYLEPTKQLLVSSDRPPVQKSLSPKKKFYLYGIAMASDGKCAIAYSYNGEIRKVDPKTGEMIWKKKTKGRKLENVYLSCGNSVVITHPSYSLQAFKIKKTKPIPMWTLRLPYKYTPVCMCQSYDSLAVIFHESFASLFDVKSGQKLAKLQTVFSVNFCGLAPCIGNVKYALTTTCTRETLTVFDVDERRFLSSKRLRLLKDQKDHDGEKFIKITALAISGDGNQAICGINANSDLYFLNIRTLETIKVFQGAGTCTGKFQLAKDGVHLFHPLNNAINIWHLHSPSRKSVLKDVMDMVTEIVSMDSRKIVTCDDNGDFHVWSFDGNEESMTPSLVQTHKVGITRNFHFRVKQTTPLNDSDDVELDTRPDPFQIYVPNPKIKASNMILLSNPGYVLVVVHPKYEGDHYHMQVFDLELEVSVREAQLGKTLPTYIQSLQNMHIIVCVDKLWKVIDVDKMADVSSYQGHLPCPIHGPVPKYECILSIRKKRDIMQESNGEKRLAIKEEIVKNSKEETKKLRQSRNIRKLLINSLSTKAVAQMNQTPHTELLVFDLALCRQTHVVTAEMVGQNPTTKDVTITLTPSVITEKHLLFTAEMKQNQPNEDKSLLLVLDLETGICKNLRVVTKRDILCDTHVRICVKDTYDDVHVLLGKTNGHLHFFHIGQSDGLMTQREGTKFSFSSDVKVQSVDISVDYSIMKSRVLSPVSDVVMIDKELFLSSHIDGYLRVFNVQTGLVIKDFEDYMGGSLLYTRHNSPYVISHSCETRKSFTVWQKKDVAFLVSFYADVELDKFVLLDGQSEYFWALASTSPDPVKFNFYNL